jgi:fumarylpyruvate hydrolase
MPELTHPAPMLPLLPVTGTGQVWPLARIFCVGRNYAEHAREMGQEVDRAAPFYFTKSALHAVLSPAEVPYPQGTEDYHFEMELAVALGEGGAVFGYASALDMTRRDLQIRERLKQRPWDLGKDVEGSCIVAPITPAADFGATGPQRIHLTQNGILRQDAHLSDMIHDVPAILSHLSGYYHLGAGDLVLTGTPAGVGPVASGDRIEGAVEGCAPVVLMVTPPV